MSLLHTCNFCDAIFEPAFGHQCGGNSVLPTAKTGKVIEVIDPETPQEHRAILPEEHADAIRHLVKEASTPQRHVGILRVSKAFLAEALRLPVGTKIHRSQDDIHNDGVVDFFVEHPDLPGTGEGHLAPLVDVEFKYEPLRGKWRQ